jgi:hypothetical protein
MNRAKKRSAVERRRQLMALRAELALVLLDLGHAIDGYGYRTGMRVNAKDTIKMIEHYRAVHEIRFPSA